MCVFELAENGTFVRRNKTFIEPSIFDYNKCAYGNFA